MAKSSDVLESFRCLGNVLRCLGVLHFTEESASPSSLKWSKHLFALTCASSVALHCLVTAFLAYQVELSIQNLIKVNVLTMYTVVRLVLTFQGRNLFKNLFLEFDVYDEEKRKFKLQQKPIHEKDYGKFLGLGFLVFKISTVFIFILFEYYFSPKLTSHAIALSFFVILGCLLTLSDTYSFAVFFLFFARELSLRFRSLHSNFPEEFQCTPQDDLESFLDSYRVLYFRLCRVLHKFNVLFGHGAIAFFCHVYFNILYFMWENLAANKHSLVTSLLVIISYLVATFAEDVVNESYGILDVLNEVPVSNLSEDSIQQISLFILQVRSGHNSVSGARHFKINRTLMLTIISSAVAYLTVILSSANPNPEQSVGRQ